MFDLQFLLKNNKRILVFFALWLFLLAKGAAAVNVRAVASPTEATVGDPIDLKISVFYSENVHLLPFEGIREIKSFEIIDFQKGEPQKTESGFQQDYITKLTTFDVGISTIPIFSIRYKNADGIEGEILTNEIPVYIRSVLTSESKDIFDIKGPVRVLWGWWLIWFLLGSLSAGALAYYLWKRSQKEKILKDRPPPRPAHETALEDLALLEKWSDQPGKVFYSRLSDILRTYLEQRYGIPALDRTTHELYQEMRKRDFEVALCTEPRRVLETSDLAKFARFEPDSEERHQDLERVRKYVIETREVEALPSEKSEAPQSQAQEVS